MDLPVLCEQCGTTLSWHKRRGLWLCPACLAEVIAMEYASQEPSHLTEPQFPTSDSPTTGGSADAP